MKVSYYTKLAGTSFRQEAVTQLAKSKTPMLRVVPEPENEYDSYAVKVEAMLKDGWTQIGYIQKGKNQEIQKRLLEGYDVDIKLSAVTGEDKDTLGVNVAIEWTDDSAIDPADMKDFEKQRVFIGDADYVWFDTVNHKAYDEDGRELLSGSNAEKMFLEPVDLTYPAKAISKKTGAKVEDVLGAWDVKRDLAADYGTLIHASLENYLKYAPVLRKIDDNQEREHTAKNWMPEALGEIVDRFVKASGIESCKTVEVRIKSGTRTGIVDLLLLNEDQKLFRIIDYKIMPEVKQVKYKKFGKSMKYIVQQNFYREIIEDAGYTCDGMFLWNWNGTKWQKIEVPKINVKENL